MRVQLNARNRAYEFEAAPGEKILYAGLRARIDLPYECGTGTCGTCKARLVDGRIDDGWPDAPGQEVPEGRGRVPDVPVRARPATSRSRSPASCTRWIPAPARAAPVAGVHRDAARA